MTQHYSPFALVGCFWDLLLASALLSVQPRHCYIDRGLLIYFKMAVHSESCTFSGDCQHGRYALDII